jgi:threonylcarbamoyladenosine tRNA methylthiotransferase MtaB
MKAAFYTLGCKVNQYETEAMMELFRKSGYEIVDFDDYSDVYVINSCTVTGRSDMKTRQAIRKARKLNADSIIAVVGCYAQIAPEEVLEIPEVNLVIGSKSKGQIVELIDRLKKLKINKLNAVYDILKDKNYEELKILTQIGRTRAYLKIQDGCNQFCTYCIIPYARGPVRSRKLNNIIDEVKRLSHMGYKEVVLTGIHVASYGKDLGDVGLLDVIKKVHEVKGIERIRMSSIEPTFLTEDFIKEVSQLRKFCRHYHVSLQSGCDQTLKRMGRRYTTENYREIMERIRKNIVDVAITTDVIVGFPGETNQEFEETYTFLKEIAFSKIHVFKFSKRRGTKAYNYPNQISNAVKTSRSRRVIELSEQCEIDFYKRFIGRKMDVLFEQNVKGMDGFIEGYTDNYIRVAVPGDIRFKNCIIPTTLKEIKKDMVIGKIVEGKQV